MSDNFRYFPDIDTDKAAKELDKAFELYVIANSLNIRDPDHHYVVTDNVVDKPNT